MAAHPDAEGVKALYASKGMGARVGYGVSPAVLVVDMSVPFNNPQHPVGADQSDAVEAIATLLACARTGGVPVIYTTTAYADDPRDAGMWGRKAPGLRSLGLDDGVSTRIDPRIAPADSDYVLNKRAASAFFGTALLPVLIPMRVDTLLVVGCSTSGCIRATVVDAVSYGYRAIVPEECVSDRAPGPHQANLLDMDAKYGDVAPLSEVLDYLSRVSPSDLTNPLTTK